MAPQATTHGVAADHATISARRRRALKATSLRTKSVHAREILAEAAWSGHRPAEVEDWFAPRVTGEPDASGRARPLELPPGSSAPGLATYASVLAVQLGDDAERRTAWSMLESIAATAQWADLPRGPVELLAQLRVVAGDHEGALTVADDPRLRPGIRSSVRADALHPRLAPEADRQEWATAFTEALVSERRAPFLPPLSGEAPGLDLLRVEDRPDVPAPLRITVMMSTYRPGPALRTAVLSVLAQTWPNLELLVVDDGSGPGPDGQYAARLEEVEALDERVRVIRKAVNGGTYRARNTALRQATGDLAIVLDSDDWWHPQTLEVCARPLVRTQRLLATRAQGARVSPDLVLTRPGYLPRFESAATVLFRLRPVVSRIGFYDPTRKGADTEYTRRLLASFGPVLRDITETTTLLRGGEETLSAQEFSNGWRHPSRHQYKAMYTPWHEAINRGESSPYLDPDQPRRFPEPLRWSRATHRLLEQPVHLDLCLAGDWRRDGGPQRSMLEEIRAARDAGLRVGVMHLEALRFMTTADATLCTPVLELIRSGAVTWVQADDDVEIEVLMVRYPPILQYPPRLTRRVRAKQVLVMANQGPVEPDGTDQRYVVRDVTARTEELFGVPVQWVPQSPTIRRVLLEQDPTVPLTAWDNPGLIDLDAWALRPTTASGWAPGSRIVVGRHSRDARIKFPQTYDELLEGYSFPQEYEVRMLGATGTVDRLQEEATSPAAPLPENWTVLPQETQDVRDFLSGLDFFLYLDNPDANEAFGRTLLEAAASGVLTIAHPKHRPTFGDAIDYAEPGQAQALIARYVADPGAYQARVDATREAVKQRYSHAGFVEHLRPMLPAAARPPSPPVGRSGADAPAATRSAEPDPVQVRLDPGLSADREGHERVPGLGVVQVTGAQVEHLPLRSSADGESADAAVVVHDGLPAADLGRWLREHLTGTTSPTWTPATLLSAAPSGVRAVLLARERIVLAAGRGRWHGWEPDESLIELAGGPGPNGWTHLAWSSTHPPASVVLRPDPAEPAPEPGERQQELAAPTLDITGPPDDPAGPTDDDLELRR